LVLVDHVARSPAWVRAIQWLLELITITLGGENFRRRPLRVVQAEGFVVEFSRRSKLGIIERVFASNPSNLPG
jgi:hypothetical protein